MVVAAIVVVAGGVGVLASLARQPDSSSVASAKSEATYALLSDDPQLGRRVYARCQACHGLNGEGVAGNYPPLAGNGVLLTELAVRVVLHGAPRGPLWNGQMPAFADQLENHEIAAVLTWTRQQWGNTGAAVTSNDVTRHRQ